jgi:hypothetical protein
VTKKSDKRDVLDRMEKSGRDWLPVVNAQGQLDGIVDRSRLTASMIPRRNEPAEGRTTAQVNN